MAPRTPRRPGLTRPRNRRRPGGDLKRRLAAALAVLALALASPAVARRVSDSAGCVVVIADAVTSVFAAGPPAAILVYVMKPEALTGWSRGLRPDERADIAGL